MKNYNNIFLAFFVFLSALPFTIAGQVKFEREYDLKKEQVPGRAIAFIDSCCAKSKVKWYGEESLLGKTIEGKTKFKGSQYSIEFDTLGHLLDVEKKVRMHGIPANTRSAIISKSDSIFGMHSINKAQIQWVGSNQALLELIEKGHTTLPYTTNYEIELKGRKDKVVKMYELLFSIDGSILKILEILPRNTDNLDY